MSESKDAALQPGMHVMLRRDWPGVFRRTIRDLKGNAIEQLAFKPGEVVAVRPLDLLSLKRDLGKSLQPVEWNNDLRKYVIVDIKELDLDAMIAEIEKELETSGEPAVAGERERGPDKPPIQPSAKKKPRR